MDNISILQSVLSGYDIGFVKAVSKPSTGNAQTVRIFGTDRGKFVFKLYNQRRPDQVGFEIDCLDHLNSRHFPCPKPCKDKHGKVLNSFEGIPFVVYHHIEGETLGFFSQSNMLQLAGHVARLHLVGDGFNPKSASARWNYSLRFCQEHAKQVAFKSNVAGIVKKLDWYLEECSKTHLPDDLPKGLCHCDFDTSNVLWRNGDLVCLIDYDVACISNFILDIALLGNPFIQEFEWDTWENFPENSQPITLSQMKDVIGSYSKHRILADSEKLHLFDAVRLSILIDCLWFFDRGVEGSFFEKSKLSYLEKFGRQRFYDELFRQV